LAVFQKLSIFAPMERTRRHISVLLLTVFLSALLASSLHRHPAVESHDPACAECVHHLPHAGHISSYAGPVADCVLCHFLGLPFVIMVATATLAAAVFLKGIPDVFCRPAAAVFLRHIQPRAPPVA